MIPARTLKRLNYAINYGRSHGLMATLRMIYRFLRRRRERTQQQLFARHDPIGFYSFVLQQPIGTPVAREDVAPATVNWFVPPFGYGSGGHLNIIRFVRQLERQGYTCRIVIVGEPRPQDAETARSQIQAWFFPIDAAVYLDPAEAPPCRVAMATSWTTAYTVRDFQACVHRAYFVQDFEPWFYATGSEAAFAEQTYRFGFHGITAGTWLRDKLAQDYGMTTNAVGFSYDHDRYYPRPRRDPDTRHVFFYARPPTPRRAFEMGLLVLKEVTRQLPDVQVIFAGWDVSNYEIPFEHLNAGVLKLDDLPDLYSQCDVGLVLSFSNLSLLPLELMACGTPVVSNRGPYTEWLLDDDNAKLADADVEALAAAVVNLLQDPEEHARIRANALATARATDWEQEALRMARILDKLDTTGKPVADSSTRHADLEPDTATPATGR
jgi:glycosyltransferase involved in cell wall biosynthesis